MRSPASPENQGVTFVELFFDLAFVFALTKTVEMFHHGFDWGTIAQGTIIFALVWWAWTQFTWALNAADTTNDVIVVATLVCTALAFFMSNGIPDVFHHRAQLFVIPYVAIRVIGLFLYLWVASGQHRVRTFTLFSVAGLLTVIAGAALGEETQMKVWTFAILLDGIALFAASRSRTWTIHPIHFCERHGLFVIIALGETLIVSAKEIANLEQTVNFLGVGTLVIATATGMWWLYFSRLKAAMDSAMEQADETALPAMARDGYSLFHFLIIGGIIALAVAVASAFEHPGGPLTHEVRIAAALATGLYTIGTVLAFARVTGRWLYPRLLCASAIVATLVLTKSITPLGGLIIGFASIAVVATIEHRTLIPQAK